MPAPALTRHVEDVFPGLEHLLNAADDAASLKAHPGWHGVKALIEQEVATISDRLDHATTPLTQAEYALAHGRRGGLLAIREAPDAIIERASKRRAEQQAKHEGTAESVQEG